MDRITMHALSFGDTKMAKPIFQGIARSSHSRLCKMPPEEEEGFYNHASPPIYVMDCVRGESSMLYELRTAKAKGIDHLFLS